jgi:DNA-binding NtrC family response regulator
LVEVLGDDMAMRSGGQAPELSAEAFALLSAQVWRGNIRELRNVLEQAMMRSDTHQILPSHLEAVLKESGVTPWVSVLPVTAVTDATAPAAPCAANLLRPWSEQVAELENQAIAAALLAAKGNKAAAAKMLGISRATLYARLA